MPAAARIKNRAGMEAFARYWVAATDYLRKTGDSGPFLALSAQSCDWCTGISKVYADVYKTGGHYEGDLDSRLQRFYLVGMSTSTKGYIEFAVDTSKHLKVEKSGARPIAQNGASRDFTLNVAYVNKGWMIERARWTTVKEYQ
jgi:hypothetical protein